MTTELKIKVGSKEYVFQGENVEEALNSAKYSRAVLSIIRSLGLKWTKKIFWPVLRRGSGKKVHTDLDLPDTITSILQNGMSGKIEALVDMDLEYDQFSASASGEFNSETLSFSFESEIDEAEETGMMMREALQIASQNRIDVDEVEFVIGDSSNGATVNVSATVPEESVTGLGLTHN